MSDSRLITAAHRASAPQHTPPGRRRVAALALLGAAPFLAAAFATTPSAADESTRHLVEYRQALMTSLGANARGLSHILRGEAPYEDQALGHAQAIAALSGYLVEVFPEGTSYDDYAENNAALPEIWSERASFEAAAADFDEAAQALLAAAEGGQRGEILQAFGRVGQTCSACHDDFRYRE